MRPARAPVAPSAPWPGEPEPTRASPWRLVSQFVARAQRAVRFANRPDVVALRENLDRCARRATQRSLCRGAQRNDRTVIERGTALASRETGPTYQPFQIMHRAARLPFEVAYPCAFRTPVS